MKKYLIRLGAVGALIITNLVTCAPLVPVGGAVAIVAVSTGCSSVQLKNKKTLEAAEVTSEQALTAWNAVVKAGNATIAQELEVKQAFKRYQAAGLEVADAYLTTPPAADVDAKVAKSKAALADLVNLVRSYGAKI